MSSLRQHLYQCLKLQPSNNARYTFYLNLIMDKNCYRKNMSRVMGKPTFCICENKDADQLRGYRETDQRLCFRYFDSTIPLLPKYKISSLYLSPVAVQHGLCQTCSEFTLFVFSRCGSYHQNTTWFKLTFRLIWVAFVGMSIWIATTPVSGTTNDLVFRLYVLLPGWYQG